MDENNRQNDGFGYTYYQNVYNMFGGYNPLLDKKVAELRRIGILAGCAVIGSILMQYVFVFILQATGLISLYQSDSFYQQAMMVIAQLFYILVPFAVLYFIYKPHEREGVLDIYEKPRSKQLFVLAIFAGLMICYLGDYFTNLVSNLFSLFGVEFFSGMENEPVPTGFVSIFAMVLNYAVMPALLEEFAFRGVLLQPMRKFGDRFAILMTSFVFALMHGNMVQIPFAFVAGLALGYFCITTKSIWTSVIIHFLNNLSSVIWSIYFDRNPDSHGFAFYISTGAIVLVGTAALVIFKLNYHQKLKKIADDIDTSTKRAAFVCTPTLAIVLAYSIISTLNSTKITSALGMVLLIAVIAVIAFLVIKQTKILRSDNRIHCGSAYTATTVIMSIATFIAVIAVISLAFASGVSG